MLDLFLFLIFLVPLSLIIHEFGHAIMASLRGSPRVDIGIGVGKQICQFRIYKFHLQISIAFFIGAFTSYENEEEFTLVDKALISIGGPSLSFLVYVGGLVEFWNYSIFFNYFILFNGWLAVMNTFPYKVKGKKSDGYIFFASLFSIISRRFS